MKCFNFRNRLILLLFISSIPYFSICQVQVTIGDSPDLLVEKIVGPGIQYFNVAYQGADHARGTFTNTDTSDFGLTSGIYLCSGSGIYIPGPNNYSTAGTINEQPGNAYMDLLSNSSTIDAAILEFDIIPDNDSLACLFIFGGEEYNEWVFSQYDDLCAIFIEGPGIDSIKNIALIPGTSSKVSINTVNNGISSYNIPPTGPCTFCEYYNDNTLGENIQYDGLTTVLAVYENIFPDSLYHIIIGIADVISPTQDAGVFIAESSLVSLGRADFSSFSFDTGYNSQIPEDVLGIIHNDSVFLGVPLGTPPDSLIASFELSSGATAYIDGGLQVSGVTSNDFSNPLTYHLVGWDNTTKDYVATVDVIPNHENNILYYAFEAVNNPDLDEDYIGQINDTIVSVNFPFWIDVTALVATFILSDSSTAYIEGIVQLNGITPNNFLLPVIYTIEAENGNLKEYSIDVDFELNHENEILSFGFDPLLNPAIEEYAVGIIGENTVEVFLPAGTDVTNLIASFSLSPQAFSYVFGVLQESGITPNDFSSGKLYNVQAGNGDLSDWLVSVHLITKVSYTEMDNISISPNPAHDKLLIQNAGNSKITIVSSTGTKIFESSVDNNSFSLDISAIPQGVYFIKIKKDNSFKTFKVLISKQF
ncbi:MAG: T9SS type A sorting domain-containing protein [Bacteroidales bacterium]|nr:T9SS type A sorting domain-containing protein [Bacteroidales bacterium]